MARIENHNFCLLPIHSQLFLFNGFRLRFHRIKQRRQQRLYSTVPLQFYFLIYHATALGRGIHLLQILNAPLLELENSDNPTVFFIFVSAPQYMSVIIVK